MATKHSAAYTCDLCCFTVAFSGDEPRALIGGVPIGWARLDVTPLSDRLVDRTMADVCHMCVANYDKTLTAFIDARKAGMALESRRATPTSELVAAYEQALDRIVSPPRPKEP